MTVPAHIAERQDFREAVAAMPPPVLTGEIRDAGLAARPRRARYESLRPWQSAVAVLRDYGVDLPPALVEARDLMREARLAARATTATPVATLAEKALDADDVARAITAAAKTLAADAARLAIATEVEHAAERRAVLAVRSNLGEIGDAVLGSARVAAYFAEIEARVATVPASALVRPRHDDLAALANVAALRHAASAFEPILVRLRSLGIVSTSEAHFAGLLFADPGEATPSAVAAALRGVRPGTPDIAVWQVAPEGHPVFAPMSPEGVPAAILAGTPGVVIRPALSVEEFERRVGVVLGAPTDALTLAENDDALVFVGDGQ